jgi:hypothetical protein
MFPATNLINDCARNDPDQKRADWKWIEKKYSMARLL